MCLDTRNVSLFDLVRLPLLANVQQIVLTYSAARLSNIKTITGMLILFTN